MIQIYHTVYENTKRKINSFAYFNKTYNPRPLDIGTFVPKRNFFHSHFSDKLKPLRIGPFKIINKISEFTYYYYSRWLHFPYTQKSFSSLLSKRTNHFPFYTTI